MPGWPMVAPPFVAACCAFRFSASWATDPSSRTSVRPATSIASFGGKLFFRSRARSLNRLSCSSGSLGWALLSLVISSEGLGLSLVISSGCLGLGLVLSLVISSEGLGRAPLFKSVCNSVSNSVSNSVCSKASCLSVCLCSLLRTRANGTDSDASSVEPL
eukprot:9490381-Pyramimonas_sp.AAC.2